MMSIRRNLLVALLAALVAVMLLGGWATYDQARGEADALFDYQLQQLALSLRDQTFQGPDGPLAGEENFDYVIRVWDPSGFSLYYSHPHRALPDITRLGYSTETTPEGDWRVFALQYRGETIAVAQPVKVRNRLAATAALRTLLPFLMLLPILGVVIWVLVGRGLRPLTDLAGSVAARSPTALDPLDPARVPQEVAPLVHSLNGLLGRLGSALAAQRDFVADAAHELRTPLAALQIQAQLLERAGEGERDAALADLKAGLKRASHCVAQLLTLARQEPGAAQADLAPVSLAALARQVVADHATLAAAKDIDLGIGAADEGTTVSGDVEALRILLANLVANALRHSPAGGRIDVSCGNAPAPWLEVADTGPGIPPGERERVFDRFYRRGGEEETGSGLGLAIVRTIADRHRARVSLGDAPGGGLAARVEFPGPP